MKRSVLPLCLSGAVIVVDQIIKSLVSSRCTLYDTKVLIPNVLEFCYLHNDGAAMGFFSGGRWPLTVLTAVLVIACLVYLFWSKGASPFMRTAVALFIGGGVGNLIDRIRLGYVIDFVRFPIPWFSYSFNIADCAVCVGAGLLLLDLILEWIRSARAKKEP